MIELVNVTKRYGKFCAVNDISLQVQPGEIFGFLGVNGAGKTTTLKMLAGILRPSAGTIKIGEFDIREQPEQAKAITGYIPDRPHLYGKLTGREFLYFVSELYRIALVDANERIDGLLRDYQLVEWQDELIESYSHGMKQRLATCAALLHHPKVLIVDEPMVGLDPHGAKLLKDSFRRYAKMGMSILLSTHSLNVAEEVSDRLAILHRGSIVSIGTLEDIKRQAGRFDQDLEEMFLQITAGIAPSELS
ncbi:MAG: ABC transporter ATP-binding protein [Deltaproteobacteria bacterium]|nr:ABC transporter ATP-binding protein [Deltaproteobacteria bacterium]